MKASGAHMKAIVLALIGFACWTGGDTLMKLGVEAGAAKYEVMIIGGISGMLAILAVTFLRGNPQRLRARKPRRLVILGFTFLMNYACFLIGLPLLPLANFYTIIFMTPMVVAILATLFLREPLTSKKTAGIAVGFIGVVVALNPLHFHFSHKEWLGYGAAFASMLVVSVQMLALRILGTHETRECLAFYPRLGAILGGFIGLIVFGFVPLSPVALTCSIATGAVGSLGWLAMAQAYRLAPAATVAPFHYSQIITGMLIGFLIWHDVPSLNLLAGAAIIIASGLFIASHARKTEKLLEKQGL